MIINWKVGDKNRHLKVVYNDTLWEGFALSAITSSFDNLNNEHNSVMNQTELQVNGDIVSHSNTEIFIVSFDKKNPNDLNKTQVDHQTSLSISSLKPESHYVFAVTLEQCSATIAVSHTLITFGREGECTVVQVLRCCTDQLQVTPLSLTELKPT